MPPRPSQPTPWFATEVQPHEQMLRAYLRGNFPAVRDVDDVVQESFLRLWRTRASEPIRCAKAFLFLAARRVALNLLRKQRNAPFVAYGESAVSRVLDDKPDACEAAIVQERIDLLADALMTLPPRCRQAVVMHKIQGLTQREVASQLGISERTVESHVRTGVARCLAHLRTRGLSADSHGS
jgi:RNA polymerase sigma-70 factor (ECF subfamily)